MTVFPALPKPRRKPASVPLFSRLPEVRDALRAAERQFLFLDFDGTLTPIAARPDLVTLATETRALLEWLAREPGMRLAIISGRALEDVRALVRLPELIYAGNHGLEVAGGGLHFVEPGASAQRAELGRLSESLAARLAPFPGTEVEYKGLTTTVHFRRAPSGDLPAIRKEVRSQLGAQGGWLRVHPGKKSLEIRPADWHKGRAVRWILRELGEERALAFYFGDDATDEDGFAALPEGITVKVGAPGATAARYYVSGPGRVMEFLRWLVEQRSRV